VHQIERDLPEWSCERVAVVVVMYTSRSLPAGLAALVDTGLAGIDFELIAVDNASLGDGGELIQALAFNTTIVGTGRNGGYAAGINAGVAAVGAHTAVLVLNPDIRLGSSVGGLNGPPTARHLGSPCRPRRSGSGDRLDADEPAVARAFGDAILGARRAGRTK
jgi:hypothetical protein